MAPLRTRYRAYRFVSQLVDKTDRNSLNQFSSVINVSTLFFQALAFLIPGTHLDTEDISSPCPN